MSEHASREALTVLLREIHNCMSCAPYLPLPPRPVLQAGREARLLIVSQAPGLRVHKTGIPWNDASGDRLRDWLGLDSKRFYDPRLVALVPMGFCYPGRGRSGDLPPRLECGAQWHQRLFHAMPNVRLTLLVGGFAQAYVLGEHRRKTLTETVRAYREFLPAQVPLPHPSPRNQAWWKHNPWFESELLPELRASVVATLMS